MYNVTRGADAILYGPRLGAILGDTGSIPGIFNQTASAGCTERSVEYREIGFQRKFLVSSQ